MKTYHNKTNMFFRLEPIYNLNKEKTLYDNYNILFSNQSTEMDVIFKELSLYVDKSAYSYKERKTGKQYQTRYGITIDILIPFNLTQDKYLLLIEDLFAFLTVDEAIVLPYFACIIKRGKGHYIHLTIIERIYYEQEQIIYKYTNRNIYKNSITKSFCKSTDENAILTKKKGDVLSSKLAKFSNKVQWFYFTESKSQPNSFYYFQQQLITFLQQQLIIYDVPFVESYLITKFDIRTFPLSKTNGLKKINLFLRFIESNMHELEENLLVNNIHDYESNKVYFELCSYINNTVASEINSLVQVKETKANHFLFLANTFIQTNTPIIIDKFRQASIALFESFLA